MAAAGALENNSHFPPWKSVRRVVAVTIQAPAVAIMLLVSSIGAVWAAHAGPFPGTLLVLKQPIAGSTLVLAGWLGAYCGAAVLLVRYNAPEQHRHALAKLALLMLTLVIASIPVLFAEKLGARLHHSRPLALFCVALGCSLLLFRHEVDRLRAAARTRPRLALGMAVVFVCIAAALTVGFTETLIDAHAPGFRLTRAALIANTALLGCLHFVVFALIGRVGTSVLVGTFIYLVLVFANVVKMQYMHAAVVPLDLLYVAEFMPQFASTFGVTGTGALLAATASMLLAGILTWRRSRAVIATRHRIAAGIAALVLLAAAAASQINTPMRNALTSVGIEIADWDSVRSARLNGILFEFLSYLPDVFVPAPPDYSLDAVSGALERHAANMHGNLVRGEGHATLIVYMIESFMDPNRLGVGLTADPIPTIRALAAEHSSGHVLVPERFGGSANSEFELLTGMSTSFLPERSIPYKQYIKHPLPSLPCLLASRGYRTIAVQADPIDFFNRTEVYAHLCFQHTEWLRENPLVPRAVNGRAPADDAIVDAVIEAASGPGPAFVFAFPSSTHHPYTFDSYADSDLDLEHPAENAELKYYVNALRVADASVKRLIHRLSALDRDIIVAILGDHLPPLSPAALEGFYAAFDPDARELERLIEERRVPLVVWSNFERPREALTFSMNMLGPYLLDQAGVEPEGFLGFVDQLRRRIPVLTRQMAGSAESLSRPDDVPAEWQRWIEDYGLLQYDALFGKSYLARAVEEARLTRASAAATSSRMDATGPMSAVSTLSSDEGTE